MVFTKLELEPNETIVREVRKHWIVFARHAVAGFFLAVVPLVAYILGLAYLPVNIANMVVSYFFLTLFAYTIWLLLIWIMLFVQWTNYFLDVWYITTERIIDIDQKGIFHREISNLRFDRIQDVTVEVNGMSATFFKYGDLRVQTAAEDSKDYVMHAVYHPEEVRKVIFEMHNKKDDTTAPVAPSASTDGTM